MTPFYETILKSKEVCMSSLPKLVVEPIRAKTLPPTLHVQLNNCIKDNNCHYIIFFIFARGKINFQKCICVYLMASHMHDDIDVLFSPLEHEVA